MSYVERDDQQQRELFEAMADPQLRERLLIKSAIRYSQMVSAQQNNGVRAQFRHAVERAIVALRLHPDAVRNWLTGRRPGHWIEQLRTLRGLPPRSETDRK
jgi:hypothetical protein